MQRFLLKRIESMWISSLFTYRGAIGVPISFEYSLIHAIKYYQFIVYCVSNHANPVFNIWQSPLISSDFRVHSIYLENKARPYQIT